MIPKMNRPKVFKSFLFNSTSLSEKDLIITNYETVMTEDKINGTLFSVIWDRIILDEAHIIRNPKSKTAVAVSK